MEEEKAEPEVQHPEAMPDPEKEETDGVVRQTMICLLQHSCSTPLEACQIRLTWKERLELSRNPEADVKQEEEKEERKELKMTSLNCYD